jgi:hypothetical protein
LAPFHDGSKGAGDAVFHDVRHAASFEAYVPAGEIDSPEPFGWTGLPIRRLPAGRGGTALASASGVLAWGIRNSPMLNPAIIQ